jgi:mono/diheme cytochrome c family protein
MNPRSLCQRNVSYSATTALVIVLIVGGATVTSAQGTKPQRTNPHPTEKTGAATTSAEHDVTHGKYLVEAVAMCGQCHTPRDSSGNPDPSRWLQGGPLPWMPAQPDSNWPLNAPRIGGTPPASDADMIKLLTTGIWTTGNRLRYPMPQFRMNQSDAEAVVAYLKSLTPQP